MNHPSPYAEFEAGVAPLGDDVTWGQSAHGRRRWALSSCQVRVAQDRGRACPSLPPLSPRVSHVGPRFQLFLFQGQGAGCVLHGAVSTESAQARLSWAPLPSPPKLSYRVSEACLPA